ncbi:hypothetical protein C8Q77DRAFT_572286 [Trametes polyzona]|nr:hypothetical protein C8Q77DRAFT_572286 [Trametes polyzona]
MDITYSHQCRSNDVQRSFSCTLFVLWPIFKLGREIIVQVAYISTGKAVLHAALVNNPGYAVSTSSVLQTGAVGGAILQALFVVQALLPVILRPYNRQLNPPNSRRGNDSSRPSAPRFFVYHHNTAVLSAGVEVALAALAAVIGASALRHAMHGPPGTITLPHAVRATIVGAAILSVPQAVWYMICAFRVWLCWGREGQEVELGVVPNPGPRDAAVMELPEVGGEPYESRRVQEPGCAKGSRRTQEPRDCGTQGRDRNHGIRDEPVAETNVSNPDFLPPWVQQTVTRAAWVTVPSNSRH